MYLHKYISDRDTFYRVTQKSQRPGSVNISAIDWKGRATGSNVVNGLGLISKAFKEEKEKKPEVKPEEKPEEKPSNLKKASVADAVRVVSFRMEQ